MQQDPICNANHVHTQLIYHKMQEVVTQNLGAYPVAVSFMVVRAAEVEHNVKNVNQVMHKNNPDQA